jgi:glycosyltransferase 2 family protein
LKKIAWEVLKWLGAGGLLAFIVWRNQDQILIAWEQGFNVTYLLVAGLLYLPCLLITFYRWYLLVRAQDLPFREVDALRLGFIGNLFNQFLLGSVGGDLIKAGFIAKEQHRKARAVATVLVDRLVGVYGLMLLASFCGAFFWEEASGVPELHALVIFAWAVTGCGVLAVVLPLRVEWLSQRLEKAPWVGKVLAELLHALQMYRHRWRALLFALALAVLGHVGFVLSYYYSALAVLPDEPTPPASQHYMTIPVGMVVLAVPITPGNLGVGEAAFGRLYQIMGGTELKGAFTLLAQRLVALAIALLGFVFYIPLRASVRELITAKGPEPPLPIGHEPEVSL